MQNPNRIDVLICCLLAWSSAHGQMTLQEKSELQQLRSEVQQMQMQYTQARYGLWEGVDVAIKALINSGITPSLVNVLRELDRMQERNDIKLPYDYSYSGVRRSRRIGESGMAARRSLTPQARQQKDEFESRVAAYLVNVLAEIPRYAKQINVLVPQEPMPCMFENKEEFVNAYVAYKMKNIDDSIKATYSRKLGGLNEYRRDMKREAEAIWRQSK